MTLDARILDHRAMLRDELNFSPSQRTPPVAYTWERGEGMVPDDRPLVYFVDGRYIEVPDSATQSTQVGMPMSSRMYRYLAGPSPETPWAVSLRKLRTWCRANHPTHYGPDVRHWRGSLCWQMVFLTVVGKPLGDGPASAWEAARILRYDAPEPVLRMAFDYMEREMDEMRAAAERKSREDAGLHDAAVREPEWDHHSVPGLHQLECPRCRAA